MGSDAIIFRCSFFSVYFFWAVGKHMAASRERMDRAWRRTPFDGVDPILGRIIINKMREPRKCKFRDTETGEAAPIANRCYRKKGIVKLPQSGHYQPLGPRGRIYLNGRTHTDLWIARDDVGGALDPSCHPTLCSRQSLPICGKKTVTGEEHFVHPMDAWAIMVCDDSSGSINHSGVHNCRGTCIFCGYTGSVSQPCGNSDCDSFSGKIITTVCSNCGLGAFAHDNIKCRMTRCTGNDPTDYKAEEFPYCPFEERVPVVVPDRKLNDYFPMCPHPPDAFKGEAGYDSEYDSDGSG